MVAATTPDSYKITSKSIKSVRDRVTNISEHLPQPMDPETFKETMVRHIMKRQPGHLCRDAGGRRPHPGAGPGKNSNSWDRIFGADPQFNIERTGRFAGKIQFKIEVRKGIIRSASVYGDFFSTLDAEAICSRAARLPL